MLSRSHFSSEEEFLSCLRDWFAGQALAGLIQGYAIAYGSPTNAPDEVVREAFNYADAMLAYRKAGGAS